MLPTRFRQPLPEGRDAALAPILLAVVAIVGFVAACDRQESPPSQDPPNVTDAKEAGPHHTRADDVPNKPRDNGFEIERRAMIARQIEARGVRDPVVLDAMRNVPRHWFVPGNIVQFSYRDRPLPIGEEQTISQPYIVALMTEALHLTPDSRVLEIGTGSGYQAAVLSEITPHVFSVEIVESLAQRAIATFRQHGYNTIQTRIGDGYAGWPEQSPFDAIIVTCAPDHIPPALIEQLKPGGRVCIPVGGETTMQKLIIATKTATGTLDRQELIPVRFVPMTGAAQEKSPGG